MRAENLAFYRTIQKVIFAGFLICLSVAVFGQGQGQGESLGQGQGESLGQGSDTIKSDEQDPTAGQEAEAGLIRLESTFVGDKEQPSVSYFIPWQGTGSPDGLKWQIERLNDDSLSLVDRDIMLRSMNIYNEMNLE
jgi:hypothetical protein